MTEVAQTLVAVGELDSKAAQELDTELQSIEAEMEQAGGSTARDIRAMVSVVRGTVLQRSADLSDEQVEQMKNSFTYANPRYWDDYYNKTDETERFDWYGSWDTRILETTFTPKGEGEPVPAQSIGDMLRPYLAPSDQILMLGCGNSNMSEQMYLAGYQSITNVDISQHLLDNMQQRLGDSMPHMKWLYMNASEMSFENGMFDLTLDKGTLDALEQNEALLRAAVSEAHRTLRPGGLFLSVTFNSAAKRVDKQLREVVEWANCFTHPFGRPSSKKYSETGGEESSQYFLHACERP